MISVLEMDADRVAGEKDAVWATVITPLTVSELKAFCLDVERLYRINPYLEFSSWHSMDENQFYCSGRNLSQQPAYDFTISLQRQDREDGFCIHHTGGLKSSSTFVIEAAPDGSKLTIVDDYGGTVEAERRQRLHEVDRSLSVWISDIQKYLYSWKRWRWLPPWRWYMHRVWQPMKPLARRITYILFCVTGIEIMLVLAIAGLFAV